MTTIKPTLIIDPSIQFGQPCVPGTRVPFTSLAGGVIAGDSVDFTAEGYMVTRVDVLVACFHAVHDAITRPPSYRDADERRYVDAWGEWFEGLDWPYDFAAMPDPPALNGSRPPDAQ